PFARSSSFFRFARRTDPLFTLGIVYSSCKSETRSLVGQHPVQLGGVARRHLPRPAHVALRLRGLAGQDVALERAGPHDLAGARLLEALCRAAMCFQFWHLCLSGGSNASPLRLYSSLAVAPSPPSALARGALLRLARWLRMTCIWLPSCR